MNNRKISFYTLNFIQTIKSTNAWKNCRKEVTQGGMKF